MKFKTAVLALVAASIFAIGGTTAASAVDIVPYGPVGACSNQGSGVKYTQNTSHKATLQNCNAKQNVRVQFKYELYNPLKTTGYSACSTLTPGQTKTYVGGVFSNGNQHRPVGWKYC